MSGQMISHYRVVRQLGAGGMGVVLLAEDTRLERSVAIKVMSAELAKDANQRKRFRTEAKAASGLNHPNICVIYEVGETEERRPYLAMEYIEGRTLDVTMQQRRLAVREVVSIGFQLAEALDAAHSRRILHRDIKPGNIMLDRRGQVKVLDFGLARRFGQETPTDTSTLSSPLTQTGMLIGTPHYMSPEQVLGRELDHRSDIFSLGVVLYELVVGQKPFLGKTVGETTNSIVNQRPGSLGLVNPIFSPALDRIIFRCLEKDPGNRYPAAKALAADLSRLRADSERASAPTVRDDTLVVGTSPSSERAAEETKLWQLASKSKQSTYSPAATMAGLAILLAAAALGSYLASNLAGRLVFSAAAAAVLGLGGYWWLFVRTGSTGPGRRSREAVAQMPGTGSAAYAGGAGADPLQKSLAVLPFANFSADSDSDYLSDGLTEEITSALSRLPGLKVAARNSAFSFKGRHEDARKIGEALRVTMLLEGSVRQSGHQVRVTAQLVNVADGYQVWSETFDRDVSNVIAVQDEIARRIAERLRMEIGAETSAAMAQRQAVNPEAHVLYLQARHAWNKRTLSDIEHAVQLFQQAIDKDPAYADAHAGLAAAYVILPGYAYRPATEYLPLARRAAARALELDPTSTDAHAVLGDAATQVCDFDTALPHLRRALELNPNYATGHQWYGEALKELGLMAEALAEYRKAEELDPLSPIIRACIPEWYYLAGRDDEAIAEVKKAVAIFPEFATLRKFSALALIRKGMYREALDEANRARASMPGTPARLDLLGFCHARLGNQAEARRLLAELEDWQKRGYDVNEEIGFAYVGLRQYDQAVDAFERFAVSGILCGSTLRNPLLMDEMRGHPRFRALLRKMELKTEPPAALAGQPRERGAEPATQRATGVLAFGIVGIIGLLGLGVWFWLRPGTAPAPRAGGERLAATGARQKSVAVMPFDNLSTEKDTDYLSDGLTDGLTAALSRVSGLKVVSRNSAFTFKGRAQDSRKVGAALGVATLLEGSLSKSGQHIRITAQLINAADGFRLWSDTYDCSMAELGTAQENIARRITERLQGESAPLQPQMVVAPEARRLYLQGRVFWNKRTEAGLRRAIELFQQALEKEPTWAEAHAALASSYLLLPQYAEGLRESQYRPLVRASANRALELDPSCAEAHAVLAMLLNHERDHKGAEEHFRRALQSDPNYATGHHWYGLCLELSGRREQSLAELLKARDLDPLSPVIQTTIPEWYYHGRDYDRAIAEARNVIETFPDFPAARAELILPLILKNQLREALAEIEKARALQPGQPLALLQYKGYCLARLGQEAEARKILGDFEQLRQQGKATEGPMATIYQGLREYDKEWALIEQFCLTEGVDEEILVDPLLDEVRHSPPYQAFLHRAGLTNAPAM